VERVPHPACAGLAADVDRRDGDAPPWIFLHGFGSDRKGQKATAFRAAAAEAGATFASADFRGHGDSPGTIEELTLSRMLEDADAVADAVAPGTRPVVLVGSSLGGLAAAWWAARHPTRVAACVLVAPAFGFIERFLAEVGPARAEAWAREGVLRYRNEWLDVPLRWSLVEDARRHDEGLLARTFATDTLVVHGTADERVPWRVSVDFAERCPHRPFDVVLLGGGDHRLQDRARDAARLGLEFVRSRPTPRRSGASER
jgi:pimeloyl-ACP methyl ester carboxylesterase